MNICEIYLDAFNGHSLPVVREGPYIKQIVSEIFISMLLNLHLFVFYPDSFGNILSIFCRKWF